jgi:apolipoprotein N-acyltransferase
MWQLGESRRGFPLSLRFPATIRVWNRRAGVLLCYEQMTFWSAVETMARGPEMLIAPSNLYWAQDTSIPAIQHLASQDWADLWAIPLYEARNL